MSNPMSFTFDHVHLLCSDISATERWFVEIMGAELTRRRDAQGTPATDLRLAGVDIFLRAARPGEAVGPPGPSRFGTDHIGLLVEDLDATARELKRRGAEFDKEPREIRPGTRIAFVRGPDAVRIELLQRD